MKPVLEQQHPLFRLAGDSAYPRSKLLIPPYSNAEAGDDETKRLFNLRLSGIRTECSENIYGNHVLTTSPFNVTYYVLLQECGNKGSPY